MFTIVKLNKNEKIDGYLYKTHTGRYVFSNSTNMYFSTEEAALDFIYYYSDYVKDELSEGDRLYVLPLEKR